MSYIRADEGLYSRREINEFIGVCRGLIADGEIDAEDFEYLTRWVNESHDLHDLPVVSDVCDVVRACARAGNTTQSRQTLLETLEGLVGSKQGRGVSTSLPLDDPEPPIEFVGKRFCFTGDFDLGPRSECQDEVITRGGIVLERLRTDVDYLVIGSSASDAWIHSSYGTKIAQAVRWRAHKKHHVAIISEAHWMAAVSTTPHASRAQAASAAAASTRDSSVVLSELHLEVVPQITWPPAPPHKSQSAADTAGTVHKTSRIVELRWHILSLIVIGLSIWSMTALAPKAPKPALSTINLTATK